jgi:transposase
MAKGYSKDLRARAVALVEDGESRREAARVLGLGASTAIRWIERWATTGSVAALPGTATVARRSRCIANGCLI